MLLDVDATKLGDHSVLSNEKFSKIIFNFPHVGGKMKIHLNRALLKRFFQSSSELVTLEGRVLVSLCKGQGGTSIDKPVRRWDDTWQVVEMAAHGNLVLVCVEKFRNDIFPKYTSVGYRGGSSAFNIDGALVYVFSKREPLYPSLQVETLVQCLGGEVLQTNFGNFVCQSVYNIKYRNSPFEMKGSAVHYLCEQLKTFAETIYARVRHISDVDVPLHTELPSGGPLCYNEGQGFECSLRHSLLDVLDQVLQLWKQASDDVIMFPGLVFNNMGTDFYCPPLSCHVLLLGHEFQDVTEHYLRRMLDTCKKGAMYISVADLKTAAEFQYRFTSGKDVFIRNDKLSHKPVKVAQEFSFTVESRGGFTCTSLAVIYLDKLSELLFDIDNWRQLWARESNVVLNENIPLFKHSCFDSRAYTFDICFSESSKFSVVEFYNILWQVAADIIIDVEFLNVYESPAGWRSYCYRITYQSFERALSREKAIIIHEAVIGRVLCVKLEVSIR